MQKTWRVRYDFERRDLKGGWAPRCQYLEQVIYLLGGLYAAAPVQAQANDLLSFTLRAESAGRSACGIDCPEGRVAHVTGTAILTLRRSPFSPQ